MEGTEVRGLQDWLGDHVAKSTFVADYFRKLPYSGAAVPDGYRSLCSWNTIERILARPGVDVMVCRRGERYGGDPPATLEDARRLSGQGYTLLVRHAERHDERLGRLATAFERDLGGEVNIHIYATPADEFGFGWHYDAEDVFILQSEGAKEYSLRKNTVHPWPLVETIPQDMRYEREIMPLLKCLLEAGDWLYVPAGYWHRATARREALSLAIGVLSPAALHIYDLARQQLAQSLLWRQRLPVAGDASPLDAQQLRDQLREMLRLLARDLYNLYESESFLDAVVDYAVSSKPD